MRSHTHGPRLFAVAVVLGLIGLANRVARADEVFTTGFVDSAIRRWDAHTGQSLGVFATLPALAGPAMPTFGPDGNLYVSGDENGAIYKVNGTTGVVSVFVPAGDHGLLVPFKLRFYRGSLYVGNFIASGVSNGNILRYDASTGAFQSVFVTPAGQVAGFDFGPDGNLYLAERNLNRVDEFDGSTGAFIRTVITSVFSDFQPTNAFFYGPSVLLFGPDGSMYVSRFAGQPGESVVMQKYTVDGTSLGIAINDSYFAGTTHEANEFTFAPNGLIDLMDTPDSATTGSVRQYSLTTGAFVGTLVSGIPGVPVGLQVRPTVAVRGLFTTGFVDSNVRRWDAATGLSLGVFGTLPVAAGPAMPTFGPDGNLYISGDENGGVYRMDGATGVVSTFISPGDHGLLAPFKLRFYRGSLFVGNFIASGSSSGNILRYDASTGAFQGVFVNPPGQVAGFDFGPDGNLYLAERNLNRVDEFDGSTGAFIRTVIPSVFSDFQPSNTFFYGPSVLLFGPDGDVYVSRFAGEPGESLVMLKFTIGGALLGTVINDPYFSGTAHQANEFIFGPNGLIDLMDTPDSAISGSVRQYNVSTGAFVGTLVSDIVGVPVGLTFVPPVLDVTSMLQVTRSGFRLNFGTQSYVQRVTIKNTSSAPIFGPISLVLDNLSTNALLEGPNGSTWYNAPLQSPYVNFTLPGVSLAPGAAAVVNIQFFDPANTLISFTPRVLAGVGNR